MSYNGAAKCMSSQSVYIDIKYLGIDVSAVIN